MKASALQLLYDRHLAGGQLTDGEWTDISAWMGVWAWHGVRAAQGRFTIPESTEKELQLAVRTTLFRKFHGRSLGFAKSFDGVLRTTAFRDTISELRKIKSTMAISGVSFDRTRSRPQTAVDFRDEFDLIKTRLPKARFHVFALCREILIAHLLQGWKTPDPNVLRHVVPVRQLTVYNACMTEVNMAIEQLGNPA